MSDKSPPRRKGKVSIEQVDSAKRSAGEDTGVTLLDRPALDVSAAKATGTMARAKMPTEETMVSADIDAILKRLNERMPQMFEDMKAVQSSLRRPLAV